MNALLKYRPEVDGLRTIAVGGVILFHYNPAWLSGGFLGVDVFFVISGYLLTAIIHRELHEGRFSFLRFWLRRLRRLYPALVTMVLGVALVGNYLQFGQAREALPMQALAAVFSFSNILLWATTSGYWAQDTGSIALLHTWSLSLEEHFYLFLPVFLFLIYHFRRRWLTASLWICTVLSLALCIYASYHHREAAFFWLPTRAWELLIGSLLAIKLPDGHCPGEKRGWEPWAAGLGLVLIVLSFVFIGEEAHFPSAWPLPACLGTAAILAFGRHGGWVKTLLALPPVRLLGVISYSLYLWHWPILVFTGYYPAWNNPWLFLGLLLAVSTLSYALVEAPCRKNNRRTVIFLAGSFVPLACAIGALLLTPRNPWLPPEMANLDAPDSYEAGGRYDAKNLMLAGEYGLKIGDDDVAPQVMLVGSSHAMPYEQALIDFEKANGGGVLLSATSGVELTDGLSRAREELLIGQRLEHAYDWINLLKLDYVARYHPQVVIVAGRWDLSLANEPDFADRLREEITFLAENAGHVLVLEQVPMGDLPAAYGKSVRIYLLALARSGKEGVFQPAPEVVAANQLVREVIAELDRPNVELLDPTPLLTNDEGDILPIQDGNLLYYDADHLNLYGAARVFDALLEPRLKQLLASEGKD